MYESLSEMASHTLGLAACTEKGYQMFLPVILSPSGSCVRQSAREVQVSCGL